MPSKLAGAGAVEFSIRLTRVYAFYRVFLAGILFSVFNWQVAKDVFGSSSPKLYLAVSVSYLIITSVTLFTLWPRRFKTNAGLTLLHLLIDVLALTLLMHSSGGLDSGIGFLFLATIATGSIFFTGQMAMLLAAVASIAIVIESIFSVMVNGVDKQILLPAGTLGVLLFVTALTFRMLNRRMLAAQATASHEADQAAQLQQLNEIIVKRMLTGIIVVNAHNTIELINSAALELLGGHRPGVPLSRGQPLHIVPEIVTQLERWQAYPWLRNSPFRAARGSGDIQANFTTIEHGDRKRTLIFLEDIRAMSQHAQQLKLASLGRLTGSIAHEIRNPLGAISHASQLLSELENDNPRLLRLTEIVGNNADRVNQIIENVLQLSRQKTPAFQKLYLHKWLKHFAQDMQDASASPGIVEISVEREDVQVIFDPSHLHQLLTNLVDNGWRYSRENTGEAWIKLVYHTLPNSNLPCLDIYDRGTGIPEQDRGRIFEPFFTTSPRGTGLGLYLAKELCETNYATLDYISNTDAQHNITDEEAGKLDPGFFRIGFAHPERLLPRTRQDHE